MGWNRPDLPGNKPGINWPNRPGNGGNRPDWNRPGRPGDGGNINIGNRPNVNWKPGINNNGNINTIVNNQNQYNLSQQNNTVNSFRTGGGWGYGNNWGGGGWGGYGPYNGRNGWFGAAVADYGSAYCGNYALWNQGYHPWYNGCWNGGWGAGAGWGLGTAAALGVGAWGLNSMAYNFGYSAYTNPFYTAPAVATQPYIDYSQPVINVMQAAPAPTDGSAEPAAPQPIPESAANTFDAAVESFRQGDYRAALAGTEKALKEFPKDAVMHEFRALCLFALKEYSPAAANVHALLASGPGWNWSTLSSLYPDINVYGKQLNELEDRCAANPNETSSLFLLAYHATTAGDMEMARKVLVKLKKQLPDDPIVNNLWMVAGGEQPDPKAAPDGEKPAEKPEEKSKEPEPAKDIQLDITGDWKAPKQGGGTIGLIIKADGTFTWTVEGKDGKKDSFGGTFTLDENLMALNRNGGGALMGRVTALAENSFLFKMVGGPPNDPGLTFKK